MSTPTITNADLTNVEGNPSVWGPPVEPSAEPNPDPGTIPAVPSTDLTQAPPALGDLETNIHKESGSPEGLDTDKGLIGEIAHADISSENWSVMAGISLEGRLHPEGMRFENETEMTEMVNAFSLSGDSTLLEYLSEALPDILSVGKDGEGSEEYFGDSAADWGIVIDDGKEINW